MPFSLPGGDLPRAEGLALLLGVKPLTAQLLLNRGMGGADEARRFLDPRLGHLRAPEEHKGQMAGFARAAERLAKAVLGGETVGVFGDYDVDGVTSCALLASFLRDAGARVLPRVARRDAGYGFNPETAGAFADEGCTLVVTCDCGTSDHAALAEARARGLDVIVVDHHQVPDREPDCYALINPHQPGCRFPFKGLASVGVAFYLAAAVRTRLRPVRADLPDPRELLDLVALGTIADMVPLTDENRVLVAAGLRELARGRRAGLRALLQTAGVPADRPLTAMDVSFKIAPLLNAPGRLGEARLALDLLLEQHDGRAFETALACAAVNQKRREVQERVFVEACAQVDQLSQAAHLADLAADDLAAAGGTVEAVVEPPLPAKRHSTIAASDGWHHGVVGIVAAKLVERYGRPALVIAFDGEEGRGSGRVPQGSGFNLYLALAACGEHLVRFGGHAAAAGLTVRADRLAAFTAAFEEAAARQLEALSARDPRLAADAEVALDDVDERLVEELSRLGPFGMGNPEPLLVARDVAVERTRVVGERHLMLTLRQGRLVHDAIAFNFADRDPGAGSRVQAAFVPEVDVYKGNRRLRLRLRGMVRGGEVDAKPGVAPTERPVKDR